MKLLLTSDLHRDGAKLLWLLDEAPAHDALLVAGDLLDIFSKSGFAEQTAGALRWREAVIAKGKSFAWCSGNHDFFYDARTPLSGASPLWMKEASSSETCVTDGETRILQAGTERIAVSTIPWPVPGAKLIVDGKPITFPEFIKTLLHEGKRLQAEEGVPWLILCHEPPSGTPLSPTAVAILSTGTAGWHDRPGGAALSPADPVHEADFVKRLIEEAQPDFSLHGHLHGAPTAAGGSWIWHSGKTACFNPGQSSCGQVPQYILLDWRGADDWSARWHAEGRVSHYLSDEGREPSPFVGSERGG